jgi:hypothetical protein
MKRSWAVILAVLLLPASLWAAPPPPPAPEPPVTIELGPRHGHATPERIGCTHTAAGNIIIAQPTPDVLVVTMTGVTVATAHPFKDSQASFHFDLNQDFKIVFADEKKVKKAKLTMQAAVIGLLRSECGCCGQTVPSKHGCGTAAQGKACAAVASHGQAVASVCVEPHTVAGGESLSINCQEGPVCADVVAGCFQLNQTFEIMAAAPSSWLPCKPSSAEFAPDAIDPLWLSAWEPFRGAAKKEFGFQVTLKVAAAD